MAEEHHDGIDQEEIDPIVVKADKIRGELDRGERVNQIIELFEVERRADDEYHRTEDSALLLEAQRARDTIDNVTQTNRADVGEALVRLRKGRSTESSTPTSSSDSHHSGPRMRPPGTGPTSR